METKLSGNKGEWSEIYIFLIGENILIYHAEWCIIVMMKGDVRMNRVKEIRSWTGLSQEKFRKRYGIPKRTLESWESGDREYKDYVIDWLEQIVKNDLQKM